MGFFKLIPSIYLLDGKSVDKNDHSVPILDGDAVALAKMYSNNGADELIIWDVSNEENGHEKNIGTMISITDAIDIPILVAGVINSFDDVKRYLYTGAKKVILDASVPSNLEMLGSCAERFGSDKMAMKVDKEYDFKNLKTLKYDGASLIVADDCAEKVIGNGIKVMAYGGTNSFEDIVNFAQNEKVYGISHEDFDTSFKFVDFKHQLKEQDIKVYIFESKIPFSKFKLMDNGLIPVVVQDYKTDKVLMVAYMNEEAYNMTIKTGRMTYYSRSRDEIWIKGLTSGHFQYVKELKIDCDFDTILAKVSQVGVPCHTGADTCFFNELVEGDYNESNPIKIFENVYKKIVDRKANPREGSYTNYLLDKGVDKMLKKFGEEAVETIVAAKNSDSQELTYEISDLMYHLMVIMVEKQITWKDIMKELSRR